MPEALEPAWVNVLFETWRQQTSVRGEMDQESSDQHPIVRLRASGAISLDMSNLPNDKTLTVRITTREALPLSIRGLPDGGRLELVRDFGGVLADVVFATIGSDSSGTIAIHNPQSTEPLVVVAEQGCRASLEAASGRILVNSRHVPESVSVTLTDGLLHLPTGRKHLTLRGTGTIDVSGDGPPVVDHLHIAGTAKLFDLPNTFAPRIGELMGEGNGAILTIEGDAGLESTIGMSTIRDIELRATTRVRVQGVELVQRVTFSGALILNFVTAGQGEEIFFDAVEGWPVLQAGEGALLVDVSGSVTIGSAPRAHIAGSPSGLKVQDVADHSSAGLKPAECLAGSVLTGFKLPTGLQGRHLLTALTDTIHLDPDTSGLPGWDRRWSNNPLWHLKWPSRLGKAERRQLRHEAEFMRELQRLTIDKAAPGSTRTKVAWCAYRLRGLTTAGRVERLLLGVYRWIGYGERPMPALITWLVAAVVGAALILGTPFDPSANGVKRLVNEAVRQAAGPLAGVLHSENPSLTRPWEYLIRAAVAVPLITAALALRNYIKGR